MPKRGENVYHRKDGLWEARYVKDIDAFGKKKYGSVYARTCREVKEKRQEKMDQIRLYQKPIATRSITVAQLVEEWMRMNRYRLKPTTMQRYKSLYKNHIEHPLGSKPVLHFTTVAIQEFATDRLNSGLAPQSVNAILIFLHTCLKYGWRQYRLPMPEVLYLSCEKKEMRVLSVEEQRRLVGFLTREINIYKFGVLLALYTGLRVGELCALRWEDISNGRIKVQRTMQRIQSLNGRGSEIYIGPPKTATSAREIPIPSFLVDLIEQFQKDNHYQYVLGNEKIQMVEPRTMQNHCKRYFQAVEINHATFHTLRHTFATRCIEQNFDVKTLSSVLGHADVKTSLNRYVHTSFALMASNMEKLSSVW